MTHPFLEVSDLKISLGGQTILNGVSFTLEKGEWVSITGKNGAGKSTLIKCLMRILKMEAGSVHLEGKDLNRFSQRALATKMAYVPQATGRFSPFSVYDHVMLARYPHLKAFSAPRKTDREVVMQSLSETGLAELADRPLGTLSGGERQKVYLAQAFAQEAELLLLDEPGTFLDPKCAIEVLQLLKRANRERGISVFSVTHDINSAAVISDRIMALKEGRRVYWGSAAEFMSAEVLRHVFSTDFTFVAHPQTGLPLILPWHAS